MSTGSLKQLEMNFVKKFIFLAWIGYGLGVLVYAVLATEYDRMLLFKEPIQDKALPGDVIRSEKVVDEGSCRVKCYLEPNCVSINVGPSDAGGRPCELKNFTDESPPHFALEERKGYIHYAVENFCRNSPCPGENSLCQVGFTDKGYRCVCRDGYKGDQCNDACEAQWISYGASCYKLFTSAQNWNNARLNCDNFGGMLVKIGSADENEFIKTQYLTGKEDYWIGLSDFANEGVWKWADGTELTGYKNWGSGQPNNVRKNQDCAGIRKGTYNNKNYDGEWHDNKCSRKKGFICEK